MSTIGTSIICGELIVFNRFNYISPIYNTLKLIEPILPSIRSSPRPIHPKSKTSGSGRNNDNSSSGWHLCKYFARKRQQSKRTIVSPRSAYYNSSHIPTTTRSPPSSPPTSSLASSTTPCYGPLSPLRSIYHTFSKIGSYVLTHQVIPIGDTVSVSFLPLHAKPFLQPKHKEVRSVGDNVDRRSSAGTSIALDSASSIHLFKDRSLLLDNIKVDNKKKMKVRTTNSIFHVNII
jgi:hypothetical protein